MDQPSGQHRNRATRHARPLAAGRGAPLAAFYIRQQLEHATLVGCEYPVGNIIDCIRMRHFCACLVQTDLCD